MESATTAEPLVESLCSFRERRAGSDAERRAAKELRDRLDGPGRRTEIEAIWVRPHWAPANMLHCLIGVAGSLMTPVQPAVAFALVLFAATSMYLDLNGRAPILRRALFRRASQNVVSEPAGPGPDATVVISAGYDAPWTGAAYNRMPIRVLAALNAIAPFRIGPFRLLFWSLALLLPPIGAAMAGLEGDGISVLQLPQTLILIAGAFGLGEIALSPTGPGANGNASGVAALASTLNRLEADPPANLRVVVVAAGGSECGHDGMRAFVRSRRDELAREGTFFITLGSVGRGGVRWVASEGHVLGTPADPELRQLCELLAEATAESGAGEPARAFASAFGSDAIVPRTRGYRSIALTARVDDEQLPENHHTPEDVPDTVDAAAIERAADFATSLVGLLDRQVGRLRPE